MVTVIIYLILIMIYQLNPHIRKTPGWNKRFFQGTFIQAEYTAFPFTIQTDNTEMSHD